MSRSTLLRQLDTHGLAVRQGLVMLILVAALAPALGWVLHAWSSSPLDRWGWVLLLMGVLWWFLVLDLVRARTEHLDHAAWAPLIAALLLALIGVLLDLRIAQGLAALGAAWGAAWLLFGGVMALLLLPSLLLGALSLPTVGFMLERGWAQLSASLGAPALGALALKAVLAVAGLAIGVVLLWLYRRDRLRPPRASEAAYLIALIVALAGLVLAFHPPAFGPPLALAEQRWSFGDWYGAEIPTSPAEQRLYGGSKRLSKRLYAGRDGGRVSVLVVESDDVHDLHAPEYCLSGGGWVLGGPDPAERAEVPLPLPAGAAAELAAQRGRARLASLYWFSSASRSTPDLAGLRLQSRLAPDEPFTLYMITAIDPSGGSPRQALAGFLEDAPWLQ